MTAAKLKCPDLLSPVVSFLLSCSPLQSGFGSCGPPTLLFRSTLISSLPNLKESAQGQASSHSRQTLVFSILGSPLTPEDPSRRRATITTIVTASVHREAETQDSRVPPPIPGALATGATSGSPGRSRTAELPQHGPEESGNGQLCSTRNGCVSTNGVTPRKTYLYSTWP
ncbi:uncharacterized protein LOC118548377 isoform X5 [Halichoerus grypus]